MITQERAQRAMTTDANFIIKNLGYDFVESPKLNWEMPNVLLVTFRAHELNEMEEYYANQDFKRRLSEIISHIPPNFNPPALEFDYQVSEKGRVYLRLIYHCF